MPERIEDEPANCFTYVGPPGYFGLQWSPARVFQTRRGERSLSRAAATPEVLAAWEVAHEELSDAGYSFEGCTQVLFWERLGWDQDALAEIVDSLPDRIAKAEAEAARLADERREKWERDQAALQEKLRAFIESAVEEARTSLRERRWSWAKGALIDEANEIMARPDIGRTDALRLLALVDQARKNVTRAEDRTSRPHVPEMERALDPVILIAARGAVEAITLQDQDWASVQNGIGWSKSTTCDGHVLSGLERWTPEQASHALRLLRVHRRQIPVHLRDVLFPTAQLSISRAA